MCPSRVWRSTQVVTESPAVLFDTETAGDGAATARGASRWAGLRATVAGAGACAPATLVPWVTTNTCASGTLKADPSTIAGADDATCCDALVASPPTSVATSSAEHDCRHANDSFDRCRRWRRCGPGAYLANIGDDVTIKVHSVHQRVSSLMLRYHRRHLCLVSEVSWNQGEACPWHPVERSNDPRRIGALQSDCGTLKGS
jgi:hypothetical protein